MALVVAPDLEGLIQRKVEAGPYGSANDVVREAMQLLDERDRAQALRRDHVRRQIAAGMTSLRAGQGADGESVFDHFEAELDAADRIWPA